MIRGAFPSHDFTVRLESTANLNERRRAHGAPHELFGSTVDHTNGPSRCLGKESRFVSYAGGALGAKGSSDLGSNDADLVFPYVQITSQLVPNPKGTPVTGPDG